MNRKSKTYIAVPAEILCLILPLLLGVAFLVLAERKVMAFVQRRKGPDVVGSFGLLQPLADGFKLILKEPISPSSANFSLFRMAPVATFMLSLVAWAVVPFDYGMVLSDPNIGLLYLFAISSLGVYGIIIAGWSSKTILAGKEKRAVYALVATVLLALVSTGFQGMEYYQAPSTIGDGNFILPKLAGDPAQPADTPPVLPDPAGDPAQPAGAPLVPAVLQAPAISQPPQVSSIPSSQNQGRTTEDRVRDVAEEAAKGSVKGCCSSLFECLCSCGCENFCF